jgi:rubrerythrin
MIDDIYKIAIIVLAVLGSIVTVLKFFGLTTKALVWWQIIFERLAKHRKNKFLKKKAVKHKIEAIVNSTVFELQKELPQKWVKKMRINWTDKGSMNRLKSGQSIIRMEPEERQDYNIINGVYFYFHHALFPKTYEVVPKRVMNSLSVKLSERTIASSERSEFLLDTFKKTILEREIQNDGEILNFYEPFVELDSRGFLTGALVREIDSMSEKIRVKKLRNSFEEIIMKTMEHMAHFTEKVKGGKGAVAEEEWHYSNEIHTYRFLLAKRQGKMKVDAHLNRAIKAYEDGVDRLYVFGTNRDIPFTNKLITKISNRTSFTHQETFDLDNDYHSNKKGLGALFTR